MLNPDNDTQVDVSSGTSMKGHVHLCLSLLPAGQNADKLAGAGAAFLDHEEEAMC